MEGIKDKIEDLKENFSSIVDTYVQLVKLKAAEKLSTFLSVFIALFMALFLLLFFLFFVGIAASIWIGNLLNSTIAGYLVIGGLYLLLTFIVLVFRKKLILPAIGNLIIRKLYE